MFVVSGCRRRAAGQYRCRSMFYVMSTPRWTAPCCANMAHAKSWAFWLACLLQPHECLIDFIAVSPEARGKGVGALLMKWAQETGTAILMQTEAEAVAAHGPLMSLWVSEPSSAMLEQEPGWEGAANREIAARAMQRQAVPPGGQMQQGHGSNMRRPLRLGTGGRR